MNQRGCEYQMFSDDPDFNRQRRNVIVTGSLIWAFFIAGIESSSLLPNHANVAAPCNLELLWTIVISYFLWRLFQVAHDVKAKRREKWWSGIQGQLNRSVNRLQQFQAQIEQARQQLVAEEITHQKFELKFEAIDTISIIDDVVCGLRFAITYENGDMRDRRKTTTIRKYSITWWRAVLPVYVSLAIRTTYFTDYTLVYLVGGTAVLLSIYKFASCLMVCKS